MTTKHTPGPWKVIGNGITDADQTASIAKVNGGFSIKDAETQANARLIAAAPDLLAALEALVQCVSGVSAFPQLEAARAAIARARGE